MRDRCRTLREGEITRFVRGDRESWSAGILMPNTGQSDDAALSSSGAYYYYRGPGRGFAGEPYVGRRTSTRILVKWSGGLDV